MIANELTDIAPDKLGVLLLMTMSRSRRCVLAGVKPETVLADIRDAVRPLEGLRLDVPGLRVVQGSIATIISDGGLEQLHATALGNPSAAPALKADLLQGMESTPTVSKAVSGKTIAQLAAIPEVEFVKKVTRGVAAKQAEAAKAQAREIWINANRVVNLATTWKNK